jgi:hypothetical protein
MFVYFKNFFKSEGARLKCVPGWWRSVAQQKFQKIKNKNNFLIT